MKLFEKLLDRIEDFFEFFEDLFDDDKKRKQKREKEYEKDRKKDTKKDQDQEKHRNTNDGQDTEPPAQSSKINAKLVNATSAAVPQPVLQPQSAEDAELGRFETAIVHMGIQNSDILLQYGSILDTLREIFQEASIDSRDTSVRDIIIFHDLPLIQEILGKYRKLESKSVETVAFANFEKEVLAFLTHADSKFHTILEETLANDICDAQIQMYVMEQRLDASCLQLPEINPDSFE